MKASSVSISLRGTLVLGTVLVGSLAAPSVGADPAAPAYLQEKFSLPCTPQCVLCHASSSGGFGNLRSAKTPSGSLVAGFIITLRDKCGFVATSSSTWDQAFANLKTLNIDTDEDGTPDFQELTDGTDPNDDSPGAAICGNGPTYGCVRVARGTGVDVASVVVSGALLCAGITLARRRSHAHSTQRLPRGSQ